MGFSQGIPHSFSGAALFQAFTPRRRGFRPRWTLLSAHVAPLAQSGGSASPVAGNLVRLNRLARRDRLFRRKTADSPAFFPPHFSPRAESTMTCSIPGILPTLLRSWIWATGPSPRPDSQCPECLKEAGSRRRAANAVQKELAAVANSALRQTTPKCYPFLGQCRTKRRMTNSPLENERKGLTMNTVLGLLSSMFRPKVIQAAFLVTALAATGTATAAPREIDLLPYIDPKQDVVKGDWKITADGIAIETTEDPAIVRLPYEPPEEYDFLMEFTPQTKGRASCSMPLCGRPCVHLENRHSLPAPLLLQRPRWKSQQQGIRSISPHAQGPPGG